MAVSSLWLLLAAAIIQLPLLVLTAPLAARQAPAGVPNYVIQYAPLVYLFAGDPYRPTDLTVHLQNTQPETNYTAVSGYPSPLTLSNLDQVPAGAFLTLTTDITTTPTYLLGNTPDSSGRISSAIPATIIVAPKANATVDVFYLYFYSYNWGGIVNILNRNFGNHVGDWEHTMVRFVDEVPTAAWYSQHASGQAFMWAALQKSDEGRPYAYSANGSHATYATAGTHDHTIPDLDLDIDVLLTDDCDAGVLWDPTLSAYYYTYDVAKNSFGTYDNATPTAYLNFGGKWGDQHYPGSDPRQENLLGLDLVYKYSDGPTGPKDKGLARANVCPDSEEECEIRDKLT
ncbi:hypothetical protein LTS18_010213 [Coniosporium uncinatum]|uniref:Uncharacterized protein n=1 Tax=Coniosporium uncinatum TaxID=93489 RepID=A0ACC3DAA9_9PEZI|nr:hypothetical protein LTS18_010213 [Coniosporium uncinatum]